ncbi:putative structural protein [Nitrincola phage 1M3-16]|uniref:portal protein n=1 Tax=Nitrincola phage 1M3-16 TaxID=1472912 RepID=UPI000444AC62|nr:portal protein [Nitrincola phage 1M3-16]AHX01198.1 putative structural protein [Nitrincola phage 1M3-16]
MQNITGIVPAYGANTAQNIQNSKSITTVATPSSAYDQMAKEWELPATLWGGTPAMRQAGKKYLPQEPKESDEAYQNRLNRSFLLNLYKRTIQTVSGMAFLKPVVVSNVPKELEGVEYNVDGTGRSITELCYDMAVIALHLGKVHLYVDMPEYDAENMTLKDFRESGVLPYAAMIHPTRCIGWRQKKGTGKPTLEQVRILEDRVEVSEANEWEDKTVQYVRVIHDTHVDIWRLDPELDAEWVLDRTEETELGVIPLLTAYSNKTGFMTASPPLLDLAYVNQAHFISASDQRNILHVARVPFLLATGFSDGDLNGLEIGSNRMIATDNPDADIKHVEHTGQAINAGRTDLKDLEAQMAMLGADLLISKSLSRVTATAKRIDQSQSMSILQMTLRSIEQMVEEMYRLMGIMMGVDASNVSVSIGDDLSIANEPNPAAALKIIKELGLLTDEQLVEEAKRQGILSSYLKLDPNRPNVESDWEDTGKEPEPKEPEDEQEEDEEELQEQA